MIGAAFNQLFAEGDVVYGISRPRERYTDTLVSGVVNKSSRTLINEGNFTICDQLNNRSFNGTWVMSEFQNNSVLHANNKVDSYIQMGGMGAYKLNQQQRPVVEQYYQHLSMHRYNPHTALNTALTGQKLRNNGGGNDYLAFRRACKFGLYYFTTVMDKRVHFILDVDDHGTCIDFEAIVFKELYVNVNNNNQEILPITYSEIRNCYKNRLAFGNKVYFYLNLVRVPAPWDQDPELWEMIDTAKNFQDNTLGDLHQNGRQMRQAHFVPAPKLSRWEKLKKRLL